MTASAAQRVPAVMVSSGLMPLGTSALLHVLLLQSVVWFAGDFRHPPEAAEALSIAVVAPEPEPIDDLPVVEVPDPVREAPLEPPPPVEPPRPVPRPQTPDPPPEPIPEDAPPPLEETPVAFDNLVLTNEGEGAGWSTEQGSGRETDGPIGRPGEVTGRRRVGVAGGDPDGVAQAGPPVVGVADLSRPPEPIGRHGDLLQRYYPEEAKAEGREGTVAMRIRILPSGRVQPLAVQRSSGPVFSAACRRFLRQTARFTPPLDSRGTPVATDVPYFCEFTVRY